MRNKIVGLVTIVTVLFMMLITSVNAASLNADKTEMQKGDIVTLTLKLDEQVESVQFALDFDSSKFEYVEGSINTGFAEPVVFVENGNQLRVSSFSLSKTTDTVTMQFKALENGADIEFAIGETEFIMGNVLEETVVNPTLNVTIAEPVEPENPGEEEPTEPENPSEEEPTEPENPGVEEPTEPENPSEEEPTEPENPGVEEPTEPENPSEEEPTKPENPGNGEYVDEEGNEITKLPQTGSILPSIIVAVLALGVAVLVTFKVIKNRK